MADNLNNRGARDRSRSSLTETHARRSPNASSFSRLTLVER